MVAAITYVVLLLIDRAQEQIKLIVLKSRAVEEERKVLTYLPVTCYLYLCSGVWHSSMRKLTVSRMPVTMSLGAVHRGADDACMDEAPE